MCKATRTPAKTRDQKKKSVIQSDLRSSLNTENVKFTKPFVRSVFDPLSSHSEGKFAVNVSQLWRQIIVNIDVENFAYTVETGNHIKHHGTCQVWSHAEIHGQKILHRVGWLASMLNKQNFVFKWDYRMVRKVQSHWIVPSGVHFCQYSSPSLISGADCACLR